MALVRWEPLREMASLFDTPTTAMRMGAPVRRWMPALDVSETEDHFVVRADVPGMGEEDIALEVQERLLTISGERRDRASFGRFTRSVTLPEGVDAEAIEASLDRGVLEVRIPKPEERKPKRVAIKVGATDPKTIEA
jgi:HSP20 family protein